MLADPIQLNSRLGTYTNFVNLLDLCGLALPASMRPDGTPFGVTVLAPGGSDALLASLGRVFHADTGLPLGATGAAQPPLMPLQAAPQAGEIALCVVGAHMSGMPLNGELRSFGARFLEAAQTAPDYRLFALNSAQPRAARPVARGPHRARRSRSRSGRCRRKVSAASSPRSRLRCRSER